MTLRVPEHKCKCGAEMDATTGVDTGTVPADGDFTVCIICGFIWVFNDDLTLREPTDKDMHYLEQDPSLAVLLSRIRGEITMP